MSGSIPSRVLERIWDRVDVGGVDECWLWRLSVGSHGYGQVGWHENGRTVMTTAHRVAWIATYGPIVDDLTVDHLCRIRRCCNPAHLRLLTLAENSGLANGAKTHCPKGHPYDEANTRRSGTGRHCRTCQKAWNDARKAVL